MVVGKLKKQTLVITVGQTITQPKAKKENYLNLTSASDLVTFMKMLGRLVFYKFVFYEQILNSSKTYERHLTAITAPKN